MEELVVETSVVEKFLEWYRQSLVVQDLAILLVFGLGALLLFFLLKNVVLRALYVLVKKTKVDWDQILFEEGSFVNIPYLVPAFIMYQSTSFLQVFSEVTQRAVSSWIVIITVLFADKLLTGMLAVYNSFTVSIKRPLKGYVQIVKLIVYLLGVIFVISVLWDRSPWYFLSGLGALTAVLILVFQSTILSFIASIQLMGNDLLRVGDWIEMPKYGLDGNVVEVALHTVKVRNWDNTIVTVPTSRLIDDSFKNWRGMSESGGRRIMRSLLIDQASIRFCDQEMIERFSRIHLLKGYVEEKKRELEAHNRSLGIDTSCLVNGRHMTNIGTFRAYLNAYLRSHPKIHQKMTFLIRQLQPTTEGLPLQIYVYTNDVAWVNHENIQSDIFDHIISSIPEFGLRLFQNPSGYDLESIGHTLKKTEKLVAIAKEEG